MDSDQDDYMFRKDECEDRDTLRSSSQCLGLSISYVKSWTSQDAFREFYQNWRDAIMATFRIELRSFHPVRSEVNGNIIFKVFHPGSGTPYCVHGHKHKRGDLLGFIMYDYRKGVLELSNFEASLARSTLDLGESTKRGDEKSAGKHGEGFKVGALVLVRKGYQVRFESSGFYWNFTFGGNGKRNLYCRLSQIKRNLEKGKSAAAATRAKGLVRETVARCWEDVCVRIGKVSGGKGISVTAEAASIWFDVALDLNPPSGIVRTPTGDILLGTKYVGAVYIQGLSSGTMAKNFKYGYNFHQGSVNRDRQSLADPEEEASLRAKIWSAAILQDEMSLQCYVGLLADDEERGDTRHAKYYITTAAKRQIWKYLLEEAKANNFFYYGQKNVERDTKIIEMSLRKTPKQLSTALAYIFEGSELLRTPLEEMNYQFDHAEDSVVQDSLYTITFRRAIYSVLSLQPDTQHLTLKFKGGMKMDVNVLLKGDDLLVHEQWLYFDASHRQSACPLSAKRLDNQTAGEDFFLCFHILEKLHRSVLNQLEISGKKSHHPSVDHTVLIQRAMEHFHQMPCEIELDRTSEAGELKVSWNNNEGKAISKRLDYDYEVTLHRATTCSEERDLLIRETLVSGDDDAAMDGDLSRGTAIVECEDDPVAEIAECGCLQLLVPQGRPEVIFTGLHPNEAYFPMVAVAQAGSFYGYAPESDSPRLVSIESPENAIIDATAEDSANEEYLDPGISEEYKTRTLH